jgi:hypothetical protein
MIMFYRFLVVFLITAVNITTAKNYYIDSNHGSDRNSGISSGDAWKTLSKIKNQKFSPGDTLFFKKGSKWNEPLIITSSGNKNKPIVLTTYGEGELPLIDLNNLYENGISVEKKNFVIIEGFSIINTSLKGHNIYLRFSDGIVVQNCSLIVNGRAGIYAADNRNLLIKNNFITTPAREIENQTDGIYAQLNRRNVYDGNSIIIYNRHPKYHSDCIQLFKERDAVVKNNYLEQQNDKKGNAQGLYVTTSYGNHYYFNNVIYCPNTHAQLLGFFNLKDGSGRVFAYHNTIIGGRMNTFRTDDPSAVVKNNIFITTGNYSMVRFDTPLNSDAVVDGNIYSSLKEKPVYYIDEEITFLDWKLIGYESKGKELPVNSELLRKISVGEKNLSGGVELHGKFISDEVIGVNERRSVGAYNYTKLFND